MTTEETTIGRADLGARRGVVVVIFSGSSFRVERQWNRGKSKDVMYSSVDREFALGFLAGVVAGVKLAND